MQCICPSLDSDKPIYFINAAFNTCIYTDLDIASFAIGWVSLVFFVIAFYPQIRQQYITKDVGGLSVLLIAQWLTADSLNLISVFILDLLFTQKILGVVWVTMDLILVFQLIYFRKQANNGKSTKITLIEIIIYTLILLTIIISIVIFGILKGELFNENPGKYRQCSDSQISKIRRISGQILSYCAIPLYIMTRPAQIYKNFKRKSVEGLSILIFVISLFGNTTQIMSLAIDNVNTKINDPDNLNYDQIAFYISSSAPVVLDSVIVAQFYYYNKISRKMVIAESEMNQETEDIGISV